MYHTPTHSRLHTGPRGSICDKLLQEPTVWRGSQTRVRMHAPQSGINVWEHHTVRILPNHHMTSELYFTGSRGQGQQASCGMVSALLESSVEFQQLLLKMRIPNKDLSVSSLLLRPSLSMYPSDFFVFYRPWCTGKGGNPFKTKQGNRPSGRDQEGRRGPDVVVPAKIWGNSGTLYFGGLQNHCRWCLQP